MKNGTFKCCICGKEFLGWGNNPWPVKNEDYSTRCCDACNWDYVIPARLKMFGIVDGDENENEDR